MIWYQLKEGREQITKMKKGRSASDANTDRLDADNRVLCMREVWIQDEIIALLHIK